MIQFKNFKSLKVLAGGFTIIKKYDIPFAKKRMFFLQELSSRIRNQKYALNYPDLISFSFWCRKGNLSKVKEQYKNIENRFGRGLIFHIAPSNVPLNFGYSFVFGFLSGNANIVRVSNKDYNQSKILLELFDSLLKERKYKCFKESNAFVQYEKNNKINKFLSNNSDGRVIWGGDKTIYDFRKYNTPVRSIDIAFSDRVSLCLINTLKLSELDSKSFQTLIKNFYNDTFLFDQNACSSPHLVLWLGENNKDIKTLFWDKLFNHTREKYSLEFSNINNKYNMVCNTAIEMEGNIKFHNYDNFISRLKLNELPENIDSLFGNSGLFFEYHIDNLNQVNRILTDKFQTLTYYGVEKKIIFQFLKNLNSNSIDRVVPIGKALDIGFVWDGHDIIRKLSRKVNII